MFISKDCVSESFKCGFPNVSYSRRDALQSMFLTDVKFHWSMARQRRGRSLVLGEEYVCFIFFPSELFPVYFLFFSHIHSICFSTVVKNIIHPFDECLLVDLVVVYNCLKMLSQMMAFFFLFFFNRYNHERFEICWPSHALTFFICTCIPLYPQVFC
jgi:hypothetical protein